MTVTWSNEHNNSHQEFQGRVHARNDDVGFGGLQSKKGTWVNSKANEDKQLLPPKVLETKWKHRSYQSSSLEARPHAMKAQLLIRSPLWLMWFHFGM